MQASVVSRLVFVLAVVATTRAALAQEAPPQSFEQVHVKEGTRVLVWTADGKKHEGRVRAIDSGRLEMDRFRFFRRPQDFVLPEASVREIHVRDSPANGFAIGLGIGALGAWWSVKGCNLPDLDCAPLFGLSLLGPVLGAGIDSLINTPIYRGPTSPRVTLAPLAGPQGVGVSASVRIGPRR
jgi:hypothetical protein